MSRYSVQRSVSPQGRATLIDDPTGAVVAYVQERLMADRLARLLNEADGPGPVVGGERVEIPRAVLVQQHHAGLDPNGNTLAAWLFMDSQGYILETVQQGPEGKPAQARGLVELPDVKTTPEEVRERLGQELCVCCGAWVDGLDVNAVLMVCGECEERGPNDCG